MTTQVANEVGIACTRSLYVWAGEGGGKNRCRSPTQVLSGFRWPFCVFSFQNELNPFQIPLEITDFRLVKVLLPYFWIVSLKSDEETSQVLVDRLFGWKEQATSTAGLQTRYSTKCLLQIIYSCDSVNRVLASSQYKIQVQKNQARL